MSFFIDPAELSQDFNGLLQVVFLGAVYGYVLFNASNMISNGSELLLLVPSLAGIVGSVVLPILGAVPDGMIVLFSGMGPDANKQLAVGVGALAGSTIMLLTIPWAISVYAGRVNLDGKGRGQYRRPKNAPADWSKLNPPANKSLWRTGVVLLDDIRINAQTMIATSFIYLVLQVPASIYMMMKEKHTMKDTSVSTAEHPFTLITLIICTIAFIMYMYWNVKQSFSSKVADEIKGEVAVEAIRSSRATLSGILAVEAAKCHNHIPTPSSPLNSRAHSHTLEDIMRPFFAKYDSNHDKKIDIDELQMFFMDLNERITRDELETWMKKADNDNSGYIEFTELVEATRKYLIAKYEAEQQGKSLQMKHIHVQGDDLSSPTAIQPYNEMDEDDEEEEEIPKDLAHLTIEQQQRRIKLRAAYLMFLGTALVLIFADPMVDILSNLGTRTGIPSFYISFVIAPLASNASELIAAYNYASKKTSKSASISISTLLGAACMNNTFCLGIFAALMFFKGGLIWAFTAETCSIMFVQICMGIIAMRKTQRLADALLVFSLYPISIAIVAVLQGAFGLD